MEKSQALNSTIRTKSKREEGRESENARGECEWQGAKATAQNAQKHTD